MKRATIVLSTVLAVLAGIALLAAPAAARRQGPQIDPSTRAEISGTVVELRAEKGAGMPTLVVDAAQGKPMTVRLGPNWFLDQNGFKAKAGDRVQLVTFQCPRCDADAVAASVDNLTNGDTLNLRNDQGQPEWMTSRRGHGRHGMMGKGMKGQGMMNQGQGMKGQGQGMMNKGQGGGGRGPGNGTGPYCPRSGPTR